MLAKINGTELFYLTLGNSGGEPPIVLMHGPGFDHTFFRSFLDPLGETRQVIYFDSRGSGRSSRSKSLEEITIDTLLEDIESLRVHLGFERIILHGHSFAGLLALAYTRKFGDRSAGLILDCTFPVFDYQPTMLKNLEARANPTQFAELMKAFTGQIPTDEEMRQCWTTVLPVYFHRYEPEIGASMAQMQFSAQAFNHFAPFFLAMNMVDQLSEIETPSLILAGRYDWICPPSEGAERLRTGLINSSKTIFENSGHFPFIEEQGAYLQTVREWLSDWL